MSTSVLDNMETRTWRMEEYVEVEADAARLGQSQNEWWAGKASIEITGQRWVQGREVMFQNADYTSSPCPWAPPVRGSKPSAFADMHCRSTDQRNRVLLTCRKVCPFIDRIMAPSFSLTCSTFSTPFLDHFLCANSRCSGTFRVTSWRLLTIRAEYTSGLYWSVGLF